jgi:integrase
MKTKILFVLNKSKINSKNQCPIRCRITFNKKRKEFSTGLFVNPKYWNSKKQKLLDIAEQSDYINTQLTLIKTKINQGFLMLQIKEEDFTVEHVYVMYKGVKIEKDHNIYEYFERYLNRLKTLIGVDIKQITWNKSYYIKKDIKSFIKWKYKTNDYPLKKLNLHFLGEFEYYLKVNNGLKQITINKKLQRFRQSIKAAVSEGYLDKDPFMLYKAKKVTLEVVFLSPEELKKLEEYNFSQSRLGFIKDLFVFSCYTGLPYRELMNLERKHISIGFDDNLWIKMKREKTSKELSIPLLPKAMEISEKYINEIAYVFPRISNQKYNSYLKEIAAIIGIEKKLTTHIARKTFASTVLLYNDVPMEIVSELLGHSSMKVTQASYGKIVQKSISKEISRISNLLKSKT